MGSPMLRLLWGYIVVKRHGRPHASHLG